jgi:hypothetical protein
MVAAAPRVDLRLVAAIERFDDPRRPIAETNRRIGLVAETLGLPRPSYEEVRRLVRLWRAGRGGPEVGHVLLDIAFRAAPPEALLDVLAGTAPTRRT